MGNTRDQILDKSFGLFAARGYKEISVEQIAEAVGVTKGAFYYFFESKDALFKEVFERHFLARLRMDYANLSHESLRAFFLDYLSTATRSFGNHPLEAGREASNYVAGTYTMLFDVIRYFPELGKRARKVLEEELDAWTGMVHIARSRGEIKASLTDRQIASLFIYSSDGLGLRNCLLGEFQKLASQLRELWEQLYAQLVA